MEAASAEYRKYLDPKVLAKISGLELRARLIVEGFFSGIHHSPHRGLSVEFADHRVYSQGDDLRHVDWKLFGKTDKYYIKEYEQETNLNLMLLVDCSESMGYRSTNETMSKHAYAATIAAAVAYLALQQQDSVGLALFDDRITEFLKPSNSTHHWRALVKELDRGTGRVGTSIDRVLGELADRLNHRTLVFMISDLLDAPDAIMRGLKLLRYRRHEIVVCGVWDRAELSFPFTGPTLFDGLEGSGTLLTEPRSLRQRYVEAVERFHARMRTGCSHMHADYVLFNTSSSLDVALSAYLATRSARIRQRSSRVLG